VEQVGEPQVAEEYVPRRCRCYTYERRAHVALRRRLASGSIVWVSGDKERSAAGGLEALEGTHRR
jgi:hypothetical protein